MMSTFYETRNLFKNYIHYTKPLSYVQWLALNDDHKAAALYVQFFNEILLAWDKAKSYDGDDDEAVETVLQYLIKNTEIIKKDPKRFRANYIYRVAYNCLYCICHDRKCDKERREFEVSAIQCDADGDEYNLLDTFVTNAGSVECEINKQLFWAIIEDLDVDSRALVERLLKSGKLPTNMSAKNQKIVAELRIKFADLVDIIY